MGGRAGGGASGGMGSRARSGASSGPKPMAVVKGEPGYKAAQNMANSLKSWSNTTKNSGNVGYDLAFDKIGRFLDNVSAKGGFAGDVAKTVLKGMNPYHFNVARISDKQAWILSKSAVENGIAF